MKNKKFWISAIALLGSQAAMYWFLKLFQSNYHYINCPIDNKIPFIGGFIYTYNLFYPFIFLALFRLFIKDEKKYEQSIIIGFISYLICDVIFLIYPTIISRPDISSYGELTGLVLKITYFFDSPALNCFPSIHCLFSFLVMFSYLLSNKIGKLEKFIISFISLLIVVSTFLVKQHYVYDALSALVICLLVFLIVYIFKLEERFF